MKLKDVIDEKVVNELSTNNVVVGIDIGSRTGKAVLINKDELYVAQVGTGYDMQMTANELLDMLFEQSGITMQDVQYIVGTGYGRVAMNFEGMEKHMVSEISCHAMGVHYLDSGTQTIIDIGGQDSKAIRINPLTGKVISFVMNDKCAAGTGRFLEKVANILGYTTEEIGDVALKSKKDIEISSQCVVFAESEIISLRANGELPEDIAAGIHFAAANRVYTLVKRVEFAPGLQFSGGVSNNSGMRYAIEKLMGVEIKKLPLDMIYAGCLGAAIYALRYLNVQESNISMSTILNPCDLTEIEQVIEEEQERFIEKKDGTKKVAYTCTYTPVELLDAAGVQHIRLMQAGNTEEVSYGEVLTKSAYCDVIKSCLGRFAMDQPLNKAIDRMFVFYTCASMRKAAESMGAHFVETSIYATPRQATRESSRDEYYEEMTNCKRDLEKFVGHEISNEQILERIHLYNQVRAKLKQISELRLRNEPALTGEEFLEIAKSYFYVSPEKLLPVLEKKYEQLAKRPDKEMKRMRLMMVGGTVFDGDRRVIEIIEKQIGARVVVEDHCTGLSPFYNQIPEEGDALRCLSEGYLDKAPCAILAPIEHRVEFTAKLAKEYNVDGVIYAYVKFCPSYGTLKGCFVKKFQEMGIPLLELPVDYSKSDEGQLKTRIEAFAEVLLEVMTRKENA
ncbi:MAG: 2-hydroxyacyl-CoA dehydratase [Roseburia sp.]|nr:2-hydroxyacyl-CoA dehydratase [Roseburia sp.]